MPQTPPPPPPPAMQANCQWCSKPMNSDAVRCTSCGKLRKDIYSEKVKCYVFCIAGGLLIGSAVAFWNGNSRNQFDYYNDASSVGNTTNYVMLALGIIGCIAGIYYYIKVSQKLKTYWWS
jgi:hypothetical protein